MRRMTAELDGLRFDMAATFEAAAEIADSVADPMAIAREAALEGQMLRAGMPYNPRWVFTVRNIPQILHIGAKAAGEKITLSDMQNAVFNAGFVDAREIASAYLAMIVTPNSQRPPEASKKEQPPGE